MMNKLFVLMSVALLALGASAASEVVDGVTWYYSISAGNAAITSGADKYAGDLTVPSVLGERPVTSIGYSAFDGCSGLTSITIPPSVMSVGYRAFDGCSGLTSVKISDLVAWCQIKFDDYSSNPLQYDAKLILNDDVVINLIIPPDVTDIGDYAFCGYSGLKSVTIPSSATSIGSCAFSGCSGLTTVTIPSSVTSIGSQAFFNCSELTAMAIPEGVTSIGSQAFYNCSGLTTVTIPSSVTSIGSFAFYGCSSLTQIVVVAGNVAYKAVNNCLVTISGSTLLAAPLGCSEIDLPSGIAEIPNSMFRTDDNLRAVTIPESVRIIGDSAFSYCRELASVTISEGVTSIGDSAFYGCSGLTAMTISEGVTSIGGSAFRDCSGLRSVMIPSSVTNIGSDAFRYCYGLVEVGISDLQAWLQVAFGNSESNPLYYADKLILNGVEVTDLVIPEGVTSIRYEAFYNCSGLKSVTIPEGVTSIGFSAFCGCSGLTSVTIPSTVTSIGYFAFDGCSGLTLVEFRGVPPSGVENSSLLKYGLVSYPREHGSAWKGIVGVDLFAGYGQPKRSVVEIVSAAIRENDPTVMDVVYKVKSARPTVKVRALAFQNGERSFAKVVRPAEFIEDTAKNIGDAITANEEHKISWRVSADWKVDLAKVKFEVLAVEDDLLSLELTTIPKVGDHAPMEISWNAVSEQQVFDALLWMYAEGDEGLVLTDGVLKRASDGYLLGYGTTVSIWNGRYSKNVTGNGSAYYYFAPAIDYVYSKMGFSVLLGDELKYANEMTRLGLSPNGVRQYAWRTVEE